jgi:galactose-1-phosphate uridylyltransferase
MNVHKSHNTRISDASSFDEICVNCGATDGYNGTLDKPCGDSRAVIHEYTELLKEQNLAHGDPVYDNENNTLMVFFNKYKPLGIKREHLSKDVTLYYDNLSKQIIGIKITTVVGTVLKGLLQAKV